MTTVEHRGWAPETRTSSSSKVQKEDSASSTKLETSQPNGNSIQTFSHEGRGSSNDNMKLLGFSLGGFTPHTQLALIAGTMFTFQILHGIFTEHLATGVLSGLMWASAAAELVVYALLSALEAKTLYGRLTEPGIPWGMYLFISLFISLGRGLTWVGYGTLSFPTVLLFKSSKIIVVMISGVIILRKQFSLTEYCAAILTVIGLYIFSMKPPGQGSKAGSAIDSIGGVFVMIFAVVFEAVTSNLQEKALRTLRRPLTEVIYVTNAIGAMLLIVIALFQGEITLLDHRLKESPSAPFWLVVTVSMAYGGTYAFTACIQGFGAVVATGMGICRKFLSVMTSYLLFPKVVLVQHIVGVVVFFLGLLIGWVNDAIRKGIICGPESNPKNWESFSRIFLMFMAWMDTLKEVRFHRKAFWTDLAKSLSRNNSREDLESAEGQPMAQISPEFRDYNWNLDPRQETSGSEFKQGVHSAPSGQHF